MINLMHRLPETHFPSLVLHQNAVSYFGLNHILSTCCSVILASSTWRLCSLGQYHLRVTSVPQGDVTWLVKVCFDVSN